MKRTPVILACTSLLTLGCSSLSGSGGPVGIDVGGIEGITAEVVIDGLMNPSCVTFDSDGKMYVADSGNGQILVHDDGKTRPYITGFETEYWKVDANTGAKRYKLGPLAALWMGDQLAVSDSGLKDGVDRISFFTGPGTAADGRHTNSVPPTSYDPADKGEGNYIGLAADGDTLYAAGQGADAKSWVMKGSSEQSTLEPFLSADEHGIQINSPMQVLIENSSSLLVLYSGAGGKEDGLLVRWNLKTQMPAEIWPLPGIKDPMGMAFFPGSKEKLAVVDNNWALHAVNPGAVFEVTIPDSSATTPPIRALATDLRGPVSCTFGPDKRLYITQLGEQFDAGKGQVVALTGLR